MEKELRVDTEAQASDMERTALEVWEDMVIAAKENFMKDGSLSPVVFIGLEDEGEYNLGIMPAGEFMKDVESKERLSDLMKKIGEKMNPVSISMMTEMWYKTADKDKYEEAMMVAPSQSPDRKEGILCTFETENLSKQKMFDIVREPVLELKEVMGDKAPDQMKGRFVNVLRDLKKVRNN